MSPRILMVIGSLKIGGAERQLTMLASRLAGLGLPIAVFVLDDRGPLRQDLLDAGVEVFGGGYTSPRGFPAKLAQVVRAERELLQRIRRWKPTVIHAYLPLTAFMGAVSGRTLGTKRIVIARRGLGTHQDRHRWWWPMDRLATRLSHVITANSSAVVEDLRRRDRVDPRKIVLVRNGVDAAVLKPPSKAVRDTVRSELGLTPDTVALVYVANLTAVKGHLDLLEAFAPIARARENVHLFLIGEERELASAIEQRIDTLLLTARVTRLGLRHDIARLLGGMDVAVSASYEEGSSNAILECLSCGLPVVATDVGGNRESLRDAGGCILVAPRNTEALRTGLEQVIESLPEPAARAAERHALITERYSIDGLVRAHLQAYGVEDRPPEYIRLRSSSG